MIFVNIIILILIILLAEFPYTDACTNVGLVISPTIESSYNEGTSIKLIVNCLGAPNSVTFTCDGKF